MLFQLTAKLYPNSRAARHLSALASWMLYIEASNAKDETVVSNCHRKSCPRRTSGHLSIRSSFSPHQFFVTRMPISLGSVRNTLVVSPLSSLFRKSPVIAVVLKTFLS